jgi:hypothetical protein
MTSDFNRGILVIYVSMVHFITITTFSYWLQPSHYHWLSVTTNNGLWFG